MTVSINLYLISEFYFIPVTDSIADLCDLEEDATSIAYHGNKYYCFSDSTGILKVEDIQTKVSYEVKITGLSDMPRELFKLDGEL